MGGGLLGQATEDGEVATTNAAGSFVAGGIFTFGGFGGGLVRQGTGGGEFWGGFGRGRTGGGVAGVSNSGRASLSPLQNSGVMLGPVFTW